MAAAAFTRSHSVAPAPTTHSTPATRATCVTPPRPTAPAPRPPPHAAPPRAAPRQPTPRRARACSRPSVATHSSTPPPSLERCVAIGNSDVHTATRSGIGPATCLASRTTCRACAGLSSCERPRPVASGLVRGCEGL